ncbi:tRNA adenosine(34) deaminase TadA [Allohahella marinimesophila]|uniref:tRNA-specific adenosine deaminase n=1 Tax=Allohahella marinimesophila TaxID=1054972 RepID=A0ABP7NNK1_9GAMM
MGVGASDAPQHQSHLAQADVEENDEKWMALAMEEAQRAYAAGEVPVGAIVVDDKSGQVIGRGWNAPIDRCDPSAHAEMTAMREAGLTRRNYRLTPATLYVTLEPCMMCLGAMIHARVSRLVFATREPKSGAVVSHGNLLGDFPFNWQLEWCEGVKADESRELLQTFFAERRAAVKAGRSGTVADQTP